MSFFSKFTQSIAKLLHNKKRRSLLGLIIVLLFLFYLFHSSSHPFLGEKIYFIGVDSQWKEIHLYGKEKNFLAFSQDILEQIAKEEKIRFTLINTRNNELEKKLLAGEFQGILSGIQPSEIKRRTFDFSTTYYALGPVLTIPVQTQVKDWNKITRKIIGVYAFSPYVLKLEKKYSLQLKMYDDIKQALVDLNNRKLDGVIFPVLPSLIYTRTFYPNKLKVATRPLDEEGVHLVALNDEQGKSLIQSFNRGLAKLRADGTYQNLLDRWDLINTEKIQETR